MDKMTITYFAGLVQLMDQMIHLTLDWFWSWPWNFRTHTHTNLHVVNSRWANFNYWLGCIHFPPLLNWISLVHFPHTQICQSPFLRTLKSFMGHNRHGRLDIYFLNEKWIGGDWEKFRGSGYWGKCMLPLLIHFQMHFWVSQSKLLWRLYSVNQLF